MGPHWIKKIELEGILQKDGRVLDLGCGAGKDSMYFSSLGFEVDAVDRDISKIKEGISEEDNKINIIEHDIENFEIQESAYSLIIAANSLPFLPSKDVIKDVLLRCVKGLNNSGVLYITLFGNKDEWRGVKDKINFYSENEALELIESLNVTKYYQSLEEGKGRTMDGSIKYWNIFRFILTK